MRTSTSRVRIADGHLVGLCALLGVLGLPIVVAATEQKKAAAPTPTHAAAPTGQHPSGAAAGGAAASHGVTTSGGGGAAASHGVTTSGGGAAASHAITTSNPEGGHITATHPGEVSPGGGAARPGALAGTAGRPGGASSFAGHPAPAGSRELRAANGAAVRTRADGSRSDVHDPKRGMDIHHGLAGNRRVEVERADHSRIVAERGGRGYVQHPYMFHGREFGHRTYFEHGRAYDRFYGRYPYHGRYLDVYAPAYYYPYGFYGYAYAPWPAPVAYAWAPSPWYGAYGYYYAPYPVYATPSLWLTDFAFGATLAAAYAAGHEAGAGGAYVMPAPSETGPLVDVLRWTTDLLVSPADAAANATPTLTPAVKQMVADEVRLLVQQEEAEAQSNAAKQDLDPEAGSVVHLFSDNQPHVFVDGADLDLVSGSSQECALSEGDVLRVASAPGAGADTASATILASKNGDKECPTGASVSVAISDLQDMQNHLRETVDDGLSELQKKQGKGGLPAAPASASGAPVQSALAAGAPPPDSNAATEISQQASEADQAENEASASVQSAATANSGSSTIISLGQTIDQVTGALGNPTRIIDLGAKKIYAYPDMKIIFLNGKVSDVQ